MILVNTENYVIATSTLIEYVDVGNEQNLIKVYLDQSKDLFYYVGTVDRDFYTIVDINVPDEAKHWKYMDGNFEEVNLE